MFTMTYIGGYHHYGLIHGLTASHKAPMKSREQHSGDVDLHHSTQITVAVKSTRYIFMHLVVRSCILKVVCQVSRQTWKTIQQNLISSKKSLWNSFLLYIIICMIKSFYHQIPIYVKTAYVENRTLPKLN